MKINIDIQIDEPQRSIQQPLEHFPMQWNRNTQQQADAYDYDPCKDCLNNPKNGGSGICACVLPYMYGPHRVTA